ncbi:hypothetical protein PLICRDRAFT_119204, partial [Plicaturopsis crispa FD-325 SS-3]
ARARGFSSSTAARKDFIQDLYLKEIKSYKPAPAAKDAHVGVVKAYALPPAPQPPTLPSDLAAELSAYDAAEPTKADAAPVKAAGQEHAAAGAAGADAFLAFLEADVKAEVHH